MKGKDIMKKTTRVPCNSCEFSSSRYGFEQSLQDQDNEETVVCMYISLPWQQFFSSSYEFLCICLPLCSCLQLRKEVMRLRSLIRRMTGRDDDASFTELQALTSHLGNVKRIVMDQINKIMPPDQVESKQKKNKAEDVATSIPVPSTSRRMNGRGIESMSCYHDVVQLDSQITYALMSLSEQMRRPLEEQLCKAEQGKHVVKIYGKPITDENKELRRSVRLAKKKE
ncbi:hypothetical protein ARALYDRAFT_902638 [Arabidopsis lyrata subsp. lyrata]|uniref:Uncharacterized protein n=1 Tax=Arabidopsis lyrata subsp. lyrata TaxID=81972 RepID=D7LHV4_ARALL|nr:hypothetical protein ARALYDRAFT_902638 [Arabidopsis lyrata subsp. lyrata]